MHAGSTLGPYEIGVPLGSGGMAEVYQARDTRLGRDVAVKVLPDIFAASDERLERFRREAHLLASLNHSNIASIYGLEESDGTRFLVLELVPGRSLADVLRAGPMPLDDALDACRQIAEALEAAHEKGIIHRDVKPTNVKITPEGVVKVLDFGLAKDISFLTPSHDSSSSPTINQTRLGMILGTPAYMSPQQARGKTLDRRADVWAFGCVLFECLTGRRAFAGETDSDVVASILTGEPDWQALPAATPARIRDLLHRCLQKDPKHRLHDIADARIEIEETLLRPVRALKADAALPPRRTWWVRAIPWSIAALALALAVWSLNRSPRSTSRVRARLMIPLPQSASLRFAQGSSLALSPDGTQLAYNGLPNQIYLRPIDSNRTVAITGAEGHGPFFSPDGNSIGFFYNGYLRKIRVTGGAATALCSVVTAAGGSWGTDGKTEMIVFAPSPYSGLFRISPAGGEPQGVTVLDQGELSHRWPEILPGGRDVLFTICKNTGFENASVAVQSLDGSGRRVLIEGAACARYIAGGDGTGYLIYAQAGLLMAVPFDPKRLELTGIPEPAAQGVMTNSRTVAAQFGVSAEGSLAYAEAGEWRTEEDRALHLVDRTGYGRPLIAKLANYGNPRFSLDGKRVAMTIGEMGSRDVWVYDLGRDTLTRRTFGGNHLLPVWTPDGKRLTFCSEKAGPRPNIYWMPSDGSGPEERLTTSENGQYPSCWSPDGRVLVFSEVHPSDKGDIWVLPLDGDRKPRPFLQTHFDESAAMFSPDGKWISYQSNESGRDEIYVQPFPGPGGRYQITTDGGTLPIWASNGKEIFYRQDARVMAVRVETSPAFGATKPRLLFEGRYSRTFFPDISPDGRYFVLVQSPEQNPVPPQINLVLGLSEELRLRASGGR